MKRKLVKQANQALTVTLPINWTRENNLKAGDEIDLEVIEKSILIRTDNKSIGGKITLDLAGFGKRKSSIYINSCYSKGIDELVLSADVDLYKIISQNMGYAITKESHGTLVVKDISGQTSSNLDDMFKMVFQMLITFYEAALKDVFYEHKADPQIIDSMDREINKYTFFLQRQIMKHAYEDQLRGRIMFTYSFWLEHLGDLISRLWRIQVSNKPEIKKIDEEICKMSMKTLQTLFQSLYQFSDEKIDVLINMKLEIRKKILAAGKLSPERSMFLNYALKIAEDCADLTHLVLMLKLKED